MKTKKLLTLSAVALTGFAFSNAHSVHAAEENSNATVAEVSPEVKSAQDKAIKDMEIAGITNKYYFDLIKASNSVQGIQNLSTEVIASFKNDNPKKAEAAEKLQAQKEIAIEKMKQAGVTAEFFTDLINEANTIDAVNMLAEEVISTREAQDLKEAKEAAIKKIQEAGVMSEFYTDLINEAKT
ncbi:albumin-binding GA domain-containing protein, partial [Atopobacter phocae]|uniref:albumin-binding GA domain-containing protein n=1 Tax=Atopobacter phocae TaxID=136492 RepID=UPI0005502770